MTASDCIDCHGSPDTGAPTISHRLLDKITTVIETMIGHLQRAADGAVHSLHLSCTRGGHDFASECRSLISRSMYEKFEAPYLARLGRQLGPYSIHSCGAWERTIPSALADPNLRAMNGQLRENDLAELCAQAQNRVLLSVAPSQNLPSKYTWPDSASFYEFVLKTTPPSQPLEIRINESEIGLWNELCRKTGATHSIIESFL